MSGTEHRFVFEAEDAAAFKDVFARKMMKLGSADRPLKFRPADHFAEELVGFEENVVLKEDVVNPDDDFFPQYAVVEIVQAPPHLEANPEMGIVVDVCAGGNHPIDKPGAHEGNDGGHPDACRRHCAGKAHADSHVVGEHSFGKKLTRFTKTCRIVRIECLVDKINYGDIGINWRGIYGLAVQKTTFFHLANSNPYNFL